ncbi:hypothetical protein Rt10032_c03g1595 [Rhodotorula toruloides]|uniref:Proteophosphoglycan ppg4 n=1 Tax=Rhodotorula toruloides TaxID=5286 RepID=A0A511KB18_RHOTO|nr:hypothetical protein Rt10032_c03g1595 [Rhodotorula toruloides]
MPSADYKVQLLQLLGSLKPGENPYVAIEGLLRSYFTPPVPPSFRTQLLIIAAILAVCLILLLASFVVRIKQRTFWLVHRGEAPDLWRPHFSVTWSVWAAVLLILLEMLLFGTLRFLAGKPTRSYIGLATFGLYPSWYGGFTAAWGITVSFALHLHALGFDSQIDRLAPLLNLSAIVCPLMHTAAIFPPAALATSHFANGVVRLEQIQAFLREKVATYQGEFSIADLNPALPLPQPLQDEYDAFLKWFGIAFGVFAGSGCFLVPLLGIVAALYLYSLHRVLLQTARLGGEVGTSGSSQTKLMRRTCNNLLVTICAFTSIGGILTVLAVIICRDPRGMIQPIRSQVYTLVPMWCFAILGLPTAILLFIRSFDVTSLHPTTSTVSVRVVSTADRPLPPLPQSRPPPLVPYALARQALNVPLPQEFELVKRGGEKRDSGAEGSIASCGDSKDGAFAYPTDDEHPSTTTLDDARRSDAVSPVSSDANHGSLASRRGARPLSALSLASSVQAQRDTPAVFLFDLGRRPATGQSGRSELCARTESDAVEERSWR